MSEKNNSKLPIILVVAILAIVGLGFIAYTATQDPVVQASIADAITEDTAETITEDDLPQPEIIVSNIEEETVIEEDVITLGKEKFATDGTSLPVRGIGDPNAPIHMVEYSSLTCSHCAAFHKNTWPEFKAAYVDTGKVYMIFREFPLNKPAIEASQILRCMPEDKHYSFMTLLFETQEQWAFSGDYLDKVKQNAKLAGLSEEEITACLADDSLAKKLTEGLKVGTEVYGVRSTPSFVINGGERLITGNQQVSFFGKIIDDLLPLKEGSPE